MMAGCRETRMQRDNNLAGFVRQDAPDYIGSRKFFLLLFFSLPLISGLSLPPCSTLHVLIYYFSNKFVTK